MWENIEVERIISAFSFSNYGLIAVQFFNPSFTKGGGGVEPSPPKVLLR